MSVTSTYVKGESIVATNPTPSTLIAFGSGGTQASFSDTAAFMVWKNNWATTDNNPKRMYLDYLKILVAGTVPAAATSTQFAIKIDTTDRTPSANFSLITPVNTNFVGTTPKGKLWIPNAGVMTVPASGGGAKLVARGTLKTGISVTLEEYELKFHSTRSTTRVVQVGASKFVTGTVPIVLNPQEFAVLYLWQPSATTNPLSFEFENLWQEII